MGVKTGTSLSIGKGRNKLIGTGFSHGCPEFIVGGVRLAIQQVVADRTVQQRRVLSDHSDLFAQAFLRHFGDILTVYQNFPALQVIQAQKQVYQRRFARPGRSDQADFFAGFDHQVQVADDPALFAVVKVHVFKTHFTAIDLQAWRVVLVLDRNGLRNGLQTVLDHADVFKNAVDHPHDPARHVDDTNHQASGQRNGAHADQ